MNGLDITVMGIIAVCALIGYYRGFLRMAYSVISWIFVLIFPGQRRILRIFWKRIRESKVLYRENVQIIWKVWPRSG